MADASAGEILVDVAFCAVVVVGTDVVERPAACRAKLGAASVGTRRAKAARMNVVACMVVVRSGRGS